ncbi:MAG: transposase [Candidatus Jettenia sp.]|nr:MAG: transposase [Candidatus Jettenia sp.]
MRSQNRYSGVELSKVALFEDISHDSISRFLASSNFTPSQVWNQVKPLVDKTTGYVICDDTLLDKRYSKANELAKKQYSGKEHKVMNGISLVNLLWTKGDEFIPIDYRVYQRENDDKTKNDHFRDMLQRAKQR